MSNASIPDDYDELDFLVEEEPWNEYELVDNSRIKARIILKKISKDVHDPKNYRFETVPPIYAVYSPPSNRGEKNHAPQPEEYEKLQNYEVKITRSDEKWNRYRILRTGQIVKLRLTVAEIRRIIDRFDNDGLPFYLVTAGPAVMVNPSPDALQP